MNIFLIKRIPKEYSYFERIKYEGKDILEESEKIIYKKEKEEEEDNISYENEEVSDE